MALKPIDQRQGGIDARDRVWERIRQIGTETESTPMDVPLHPGAERWFREHGYRR